MNKSINLTIDDLCFIFDNPIPKFEVFEHIRHLIDEKYTINGTAYYDKLNTFRQKFIEHKLNTEREEKLKELLNDN